MWGLRKPVRVRPASAEESLPVNATANVDLDIKSWIWTIAGYYRALDQNGDDPGLAAGARYLDVEQSVNWNTTGNVGSDPGA
jgi:hypothetical protein